MKYLRRKGRWANGESKYIIEQDNNYIATLPKVEQLLKQLRPNNNQSKPSQSKEDLHREECKTFR